MKPVLIMPFTEDFRPEVEEIFFETSSKKEFKDEAERRTFLWKYLSFYLATAPDLAFVALEGRKVLGYVLGVTETEGEELTLVQPHLKKFAAHFKNYPAHLHINCHLNSRGKGVGKALIERFCEELHKRQVRGLHIMTGPQSENRFFYRKLGFDFEREVDSILFMGRSF